MGAIHRISMPLPHPRGSNPRGCGIDSSGRVWRLRRLAASGSRRPRHRALQRLRPGTPRVLL